MYLFIFLCIHGPYYRRQALPSIALSVLRGVSGVHGDMTPPIDISRCRSLVYSLDAYMYIIKNATRTDAVSAQVSD